MRGHIGCCLQLKRQIQQTICFLPNAVLHGNTSCTNMKSGLISLGYATFILLLDITQTGTYHGCEQTRLNPQQRMGLLYLSSHKNKYMASYGIWLLIFKCDWSLHRKHIAPSDNLEVLHCQIRYPVQNGMQTCTHVNTHAI